MTHLLLLAGVFICAGVVQGITGFGSALVALPLLTLFMDIKVAVPLMALSSLVLTLSLSWQLKRHLDRDKLLPLFLGTVPGIVVGSYFLKHVDGAAVKLLLGIMLTLYAGYGLLAKPRALNLGRGWAGAAGFLTGAFGAAFSAGGPPTIVYTSLTGWTKDQIKATLSGFFLGSGLLVVISHAVIGMTTSTVLRDLAVAAPFILVGMWLGIMIYSRLGEGGYRRMVYVLLAVLGVFMLIKSIVELNA